MGEAYGAPTEALAAKITEDVDGKPECSWRGSRCRGKDQGAADAHGTHRKEGQGNGSKHGMEGDVHDLGA